MLMLKTNQAGLQRTVQGCSLVKKVFAQDGFRVDQHCANACVLRVNYP